jgi:hypothetical protein
MAAFPVSSTRPESPGALVLRAAVAAYLGRYRGLTRQHSESFLRWCTDHELDPLAAVRVDIERYVRWLQDVGHYQPSTVSRWLSIVVGFYRVCVIDGLLSHSPADYVRRPTVPAESPTLGLGHLQFEALITTARLLPNPNDFALVALLGLLGLRIFEACAPTSPTSAKNTATASCACAAKAARSYSSPCRQQWLERSSAPSANAPTDRSCATPSADAWTATPPPAGSDTWPSRPACECLECIPTCCATRSSQPCWMPGQPPRRADRRPPRRPPHHHALRPCPQQP